MGQDVKNQTRFCQVPDFSKKGSNMRLKSRTIMAVGLTFMLTTTGLAFYLIQPTPFGGIIPGPEKEPKVYTPHGVIAIDGDANFSDTALLEGWPGDGSPENPYVIDGLEIDLGGDYGHCIDIWNTQVSFIISNCNLTGAFGFPLLEGVPMGTGIALSNVINGHLVNNILYNNGIGIRLEHSDCNTVANNTCIGGGIILGHSHSNIVDNNTCNATGIGLYGSNSNTVANNTCNSNDGNGIEIDGSFYNTVVYNTCNNNDENGIGFYGSHHNIVENNTCNYNEIGIYLHHSTFNKVVNNTYLGNTEHGIYFYNSSVITETVFLLSIGLAGAIMLGAGWRMVKLSRGASKGE